MAILLDERDVLFLDTETYCSVAIKKAGAFKYTEAPDFELLLLPYAWNDDPVEVLDMTEIANNPDAQEVLQKILAALRDPNVIKVAHNTSFERNAYRHSFGFYQPPEQWVDTMVLAAYNGLPMSLENAGEALALPVQKRKDGKALINYFCKPCKPTIANGGRTRNLPQHAPEKWERFKLYARDDVEVERLIYHRLARYPVTDFERQVWSLDARINERGVLVDLDLVHAAIDVDTKSRQANLEELGRLTGLDNPNSVPQLRRWLEGVGLPCDSLNKATVADLKKAAIDPTTRRVLELRSLLGKTSTKKYEAMVAAAGLEDRVRGITQYYGAGRTGRWAGRLVQLQNLPQNHLEDIGTVREIVRARDLDTLDLIFDSVADTLSQLIRTALVAKPGHTFLVSDYAAIEARVIAYLAGERWRLDVFKNGGDIYCSSASQMFKVPVVKHGVNGHLRQKGKVAELACIAEGQPVLTDCGLVPIEQVTQAMKVWDGVEWVNHDGVIYKGEKEVLTYGGLEATADHIVWAEIEGQKRPLRFGDAATCGAHLLQTGNGWHPVRLGGSHQPGETLERRVEPLLCADPLQRLQFGAMAGIGEPENRQVERLSKLFPAEGGSPVVGPAVYGGKTTLHQSERRQLQELRGTGHQVPIRECDGGGPLYDRDAWATVTRDGAGPDRRQRPLRTGKPAVGDAPAKLCKPTAVHRKVKVYDILNAGPRHRFTVSDVLVHNCGYGGGVAALKAFGADKMGLSEIEMQDIVTQWRAASPTIPKLWSAVERAAKSALKEPGKAFHVYRPGNIPGLDGVVATYRKDWDALRCTLPSGRILTYWNARLEDFKGRPSVVFMAQNQTTRKWEKTETWGGKLVENIVQAVARDCLAVAMVRLEAAGFDIVFHVHDEVVIEAPAGSRWEDAAAIMGEPINWAPGLLLRGDGYETKFYMKD